MEIRKSVAEWNARYEHLDSDVVAKSVVDSLGDDWREIILPLVIDEVNRQRRDEVRACEIRALGSGRTAVFARQAARPKINIEGPRPTNVAELRELLDKSFADGLGAKILWGEATVEQHQARVTYLRKKVHGLESTASKHVAAIEAIEAAGVKCLKEIKL